MPATRTRTETNGMVGAVRKYKTLRYNNFQLFVCSRVCVFSCKLSLCACADNFHKGCWMIPPIQQATAP
jgi:hypothetical protein